MSERDGRTPAGRSRRGILLAGAAGLVGATGLSGTAWAGSNASFGFGSALLDADPDAGSVLERGAGLEVPELEVPGLRPSEVTGHGLAPYSGRDLVLPPSGFGPSGPTGAVSSPITRNYLDSTGCKLYYEPSGNAASFTFNKTFYDQLATWKRWTDGNAPSSWGWPYRVYSYGVYVNKPGYHGLGRAFDLAKIQFKNSAGSIRTISCRYDKWKNGSTVTTDRKRYWGLACGLARRYSYVLTYLFNSDHHNHIHVDNAVYGSPGNSDFNGISSQTYIVQAACRYIWGKSTGLDGSYGPESKRHSTEVLRRIGRSSGTIDTRGNWDAFCTASFRKAVGTQAY